MKTKIFLILALSIPTVVPAVDYTFEKTYTETLGLDENDAPFPGSNWIVDLTAAYSNECDDFNTPSGYYYDTKPEMRNSVFLKNVTTGDVTEYISKAISNCSSVTNALDPLHRAIWNNMGLVQKTEFGVINKTCGPGYSCNDVSLYQSIEKKRVDTLTPTEGTNATKAADFEIFAYNIENIIPSISNGIPGVGGLANIIQSPDVIKYCYQLKDASSEGVDSPFALRPEYNLKTINWNSFDQNANKKSGVLNGETSGKAYIYKGLDSSMRSWISNDISDGL